MPFEGVKALTLDVFGTIVDFRSSIIRQGEELGRAKGVTVDWAAFHDEWYSAYRPAMIRINNGEEPWANIGTIYRRRLEELLDTFGITGLTHEEKERFNHAWCRLDPWPDAVAGLRRLKKKYILSTLSNGDVGMLTRMAKFAGLPWDCVLCSEIFRRYKPAPEVYLGAIGLLGLKPHEVMMVASHNYDLRAARSHGMKTGFFARPVQYGPDQKIDLEAEEDWDVIADDVEDLAEKLGV